jgi:hypothetical protein
MCHSRQYRFLHFLGSAAGFQDGSSGGEDDWVMYFELRKWIMDVTHGMDSSSQKAAQRLPILLLFIKIPHCDRVYTQGRSNECYFAKYLCTQKTVKEKTARRRLMESYRRA